MHVLEKSIWENIRGGDLRAFELLFESSFKGLHNYATDMLKSSPDAEEIVQDVFFQVWEKRETIFIHTSVKAYLFRSVHNHCLNFIQHRKSTEKSVEFIHGEEGQSHASSLVNTEYALDQMIAADLEHEVETAINSLPQQCREVFYLSRFENLKIREVATRLNVSESTVKTQLYRALEKLRDLLKEHLKDHQN